MKTNISELVFILDRSSSMSGLEAQTLAGFNKMLSKQKELVGECYLTTILFSHTYEILHNRLKINEVSKLSEEDYYVNGSTALIDALGKTIKNTSKILKRQNKRKQKDKVIFIIITDGQENSSKLYSSKEVKKMIESKQELGWEFIFLGANIDAVETAKDYGINANRAINFHADKAGVDLNFMAINDALISFRKYSQVNDNWDNEIVDDYKKRKKK